MSLPSGIWEPHGIRRFKDRLYPEIVLSARLTILRNIQDQPFPDKALEEDRRKYLQQLTNDVLLLEPWSSECFQIDSATVDSAEAVYLQDRGLVDDAFDPTIPSRVLISSDSRVSIQICGRNWIRWNGVGQGVAFERLWEAFGSDCLAFQEYSFEKSSELGFLTASPLDVGGCRLRAIVHIPGLYVTDSFQDLSQELSDDNIEITALDGSNRVSPGALAMVTHVRTAGLDPMRLCNKMERAVLTIARKERAARRAMLRAGRSNLEDMIARGFGLIRHARNLAAEEFLVLHSSLRLGTDFGWIRGLQPNTVEWMFERSSDAYLKMRTGKSDDELLRERAKQVREMLTNARLHFIDSMTDEES